MTMYSEFQHFQFRGDISDCKGVVIKNQSNVYSELPRPLVSFNLTRIGSPNTPAYAITLVSIIFYTIVRTLDESPFFVLLLIKVKLQLDYAII